MTDEQLKADKLSRWKMRQEMMFDFIERSPVDGPQWKVFIWSDDWPDPQRIEIGVVRGLYRLEFVPAARIVFDVHLLQQIQIFLTLGERFRDEYQPSVTISEGGFQIR
jgi:hypothetical protein